MGLDEEDLAEDLCRFEVALCFWVVVRFLPGMAGLGVA